MPSETVTRSFRENENVFLAFEDEVNYETTKKRESARGRVTSEKSLANFVARIIENFTVFDFSLSTEDMDTIKTLDRKVSSFFDHRDPATVKRLSGVRLDI